MKRRIFALLMAVVMLISAIPSQAITANAADSDVAVYNITDSYGSVVISGKVNWHDADNAAGLRPSSVTVNLYANGTKVMTDTASAPDWEYSFDLSNGLNGFESPAGLTYTIEQEPIANYSLLSVVHPTVTFVDPSTGDGWETKNPCNSLDWENTSTGQTVVACRMTNGNIVFWTPEPLAAFERELIKTSLLDNVNSVNNPKGYVYLSGQGESNEYGVTIDSATIKFGSPNLWNKFFVGTYLHGSSTTTENSITNTLLTNVRVSKVWNDADNQDGIRPQSITVHLLKNSEHVGSPVTLNAANNWSASWNVPLVDENGNTITYHVEESVPTGYTSVVTGNAANGFVVTNTHVTERTNVQVQKVWHDDNNRDGIRPHGVVVQLYKNGQPVTSYTDSTGKTVSGTATLTNNTSWTQQWLDLEKNSAGTANVYTVQEVGYVDANGKALANPGYTVGYDTDETGRLVVENTHASKTMDIPVQKVWNDADNRDGIRPASVTVTLLANGTSTGKTLTLNAANNWKGIFEDVYVNSAGAPITYSITEAVPNGYTYAVTGTAAEGFTVTNTHTPETISVPVNKIWDDAGDQDGLRPHEITVALYADGVATGDTLVLNKTNNWAGSFTGKAKFKAGAVGTAIAYTVQEVNIPNGYTPSYNGTTITNTHTPLTADLTVHKVWNDFNNNDHKRPASVTIALHANSQATGLTLTLSESNNWTGTWQDMPRYQNGQWINYTVVENGIPEGYSVDYKYSSTDTAGTATITNTYSPETTGLNIQKVWDDDDNREGIRPASVTVTLYQQIGSGTPTVVTDSDGNPLTVVLNAANEWDADFTGLPKMSNGQTIKYSVVETPVDGYTTAYSEIDGNNVLTITNTHEVNRSVKVTATKVWNDNNNQDNLRPEKITFTLYANGEKVTDLVVNGQVVIPASITLDATVENATATWEGLYEYYRGEKIYYTVRETGHEMENASAQDGIPVGYSVRYDRTVDEENHTVACTITNTHDPAKISIPVSKVWVDADDQDGKRPDSISVKLYANGTEAAVDSLTLSTSNNWTASFTNLPQFANGQEIVYEVIEVGESNGKVTYNGAEYTVTYDQTAYTITNTYTPEKTTVSVTKVWDDDDGTGVERPASVKMHLLANGDHTGDVIELNANYGWTHTWTELPKYIDGLVINYTVSEEQTDELRTKGYSASYAYNGNQVTVTNTRSLEKTSFSVQKIWNDTYNQDNLRPQSINVQLLADGQPYGDPVTLSAGTNWSTTWSGLQKYRTGSATELIEYTVKEAQLPAGYTASYGTDSYTGIYTITNTHEVEKTEVTVTKVWDDADNQDGIRPGEVTVTLYRNGVATTKTATLDKTNHWTHTFTGLDVHHGIGVDNVYTVVESGVPAGYTSKTTGDAATGYTITNTHTPEVVSVTTRKEWNDGNDQDGKRPTSITVELLADGKTTGKTVELGVTNNWTASFDKLTKYKSGAVGTAIVYTVKEVDVPSGYADTYNGNLITNTHTPETADLTVKKLWNDFGNNDGKRPFAVVITLYQNGTSTGMMLELNAGNKWTGKWEDMPRYHNGQRISYTVVETGYYLTEGAALTPGVPSGYTVTHSYDYANATAYVTNSYTPETTSLNVQKIWDDDDNRDGKRPDSVTVTLWRKIGNGDWQPVPDASGKENSYITAIMSAENEWDISFTGLPKHSQGAEILYKVVEEQVAGYLEPTYQFDTAARMVTITNKRDVDRVTVTGTKVWADTNNQDGIRPEKVVLTLYANGINTGSTITLDGTVDSNGESTAWVATWDNLLRNYRNKEIVYTVVEEVVANGYTVAYARSTDADGNTACTITNTHKTDLVTIPVTKIWDDADDQDAIRPSEVKVTLYANGTEINALTLKASENWVGSFGEHPANADGKPIVYTVKEAATDGYTATYSTDKTVAGILAMQVKNTHTPYQTTLTVNKVWDDNNDQDGKRPDSIVVHLLADGVHTTMKVTLTAEMDWTYTWTGLDKYAAGQLIRYTVYEEPVTFKGTSTDNNARAIDTYFASYVRNPEDPTKITITNAYTPETTEITVMKVWNDGNNRDNLRSETVTAELYADGVTTGKTVILNEKNNWEAVWENLPKYKDHGKEIVYTVVENNIPDGYTVTIAQESEYSPGTFIITNTYSPAHTSVTVNKAWNDADDNDRMRPQKVKVTLLCNGEALYTATLSEATKWSHTWAGLYKFVGGKEAVYTVEESPVDGYTAAYAKSNDKDGYTVWTVTNTHEVMTTELVVTTIWVDDNNSQETRPDKVPAQLYKDGEPYGEVFDITVDKDWQTTIVVPVYEDGKEVEWTVQQVKTPNPYTVTYDQGKLTIINTARFDDSPATGDTFNPVIIISLMVASLAGIIAIILIRRKKMNADA